MRPLGASLALKLNLALLAFFLALGAASVGIVLYGFNRTQDNATARSNEALESIGLLALQAVAGGAGEQGGLLFESVAETGQRASRYLDTSGQPPTDAALPQFSETASGIFYDPRPDRVSDLVVLNESRPDEQAVREDIAFSASLDTILPVLFENFAGEVGGANLDPIAIVFISTNSVSRYYPPIGIHETLPANLNIADRMDLLGPVKNPTRRTLWTAPYDDSASRGRIITARTPVYDGDTFRGSLEVDVSIDRVIAQINQVHPTPSGFAFYVDGTGELWRSDAYDLLTDEASRNPQLSGLLGRMASGQPPGPDGVAKVRFNGEDFFIGYEALPVLGGGFGIAAPESEITAQAAGITGGIDREGNRTVIAMLVAMAVLFVAGLVGAGYLNRRVILLPVQQLATATRAVAAGDLSATVPTGRGDELGELASGFNVMVEQLRESERHMEQRVTDRTRELNALLDVSRSVAATVELAPLLDVILDQLRSLIDYEGGAVVLQEGGDLVQVALRRPPFAPMPPPGARPVARPLNASTIIWERLKSGDAVVIDDVHGDSEFAIAYRNIDEGELRDSQVAWIHAWAAIPLAVGDNTIGLLAFAHSEPGHFTEESLRLGRAVADQVAVAIENAHLFEHTQQQARDMEALLRADAELFGSLELDSVLQSLVDVAIDVLGVDKSLVTLWDREHNTAEVRAARNFAPESLAIFAEMLPTPQRGTLRDDVQPNVFQRKDEPNLPDAARSIMDRENIHSSMDIPIRSRTGEVIGGYGVGYTVEHEFGDNERRLLFALADRAAVAIRNAELHEKAQQAASLEERQRLARELHDSVSQALYGIALGTRTARMRLGDDPHNAAEPIDYVMSLAQAGLAEMRALIFELRPESLELEGVVAAIEKQAASTQARYKLAVETALGDEPDCPLDVKEALYRITQEALHNVVKHAQAQRVEVRLERDGVDLVLSIRDDGRGFDASASFPGHVGLRSMPERAAKLGGTVVIESTPGSGTRVVARIPA